MMAEEGHELEGKAPVTMFTAPNTEDGIGDTESGMPGSRVA